MPYPTVPFDDTSPDSPPPQKLSKEDILQLENYFLKLENIKKGGELLQHNLRLAGEQMRSVQTELSRFRTELSSRYGVDLATVRLLPDGTILPGTSGGGNDPIGAALGGQS